MYTNNIPMFKRGKFTLNEKDVDAFPLEEPEKIINYKLKYNTNM